MSSATEHLSDQFTPSYVSSRSANSLISFSRPTRIQENTLHYLNRILDELLLHILASAKSLATDRIKTDGILRVLGGQSGSGSGVGALLAKNAVLEAELELRGYLEGQRKEGGKMPLGLSATSRLDGTSSFPIQSAYSILRIRCQYFSTLGDLEDPDRRTNHDQNIMSSDGRPIATITSGVSIYVTALLEFVAEYILQNIARVIERDNSDEASLHDLIKAIEEDEGTAYVWTKMDVRKDVYADHERERQSGGKVVQRPWQVPDEDQLDMAAGKKYKRQSLSTTASSQSIMTPSSSNRRITTFNGQMISDSSVDPKFSAAAAPTVAQQYPQLKRRMSSERGAWFLGKRRSSFRSSQDLGSAFAAGSRESSQSGILQPSDTNADSMAGSALDTGDDFDDLVLSGQTMKVSLTPNRLRSMDNTGTTNNENEAGKRGARRRPGTGSLSLVPPTGAVRGVANDEARPDSRAAAGRPDSRRSTQKNSTAPPSSYRSLDAEGRSIVVQTPDLGGNLEEEPENHWQPADPRRKTVNVREMVEAINGQGSPSPTENNSITAPPSNGRESRMSLASLTSTSDSKRLTFSAAGGKVRNLFGRKTSSTIPSPNPSVASTSASRNVSGDQSATPSMWSSSVRTGRDVSRTQRSGSIPNTLLTSNVAVPMAQAASFDTASMQRSSSRSPELTRQVDQEPANELQATSVNEHTARSATPGLVGLYEEPKANASTSTVSSAVQQQTSRKVPWAYNRAPPSSHLSNGRRASGPMVGRASSSQGGHSGNEHGYSSAAVSPTAVAPPSAWAQNGLAVGDGDALSTTTAAYGNRTPIVGVSPTFGRTSPSVRTSFQASTGNKQVDTARVLVQLNQKMRDCQSVEECQRLVMQALAVAAAAVHQEQETHHENVTEAMKAVGLTIASTGHALEIEPVSTMQGTDKCVGTDTSTASVTPVVRGIVYRNLALPMAIGYEAENDDLMPAFRRQSQVAAWLLGEVDQEPELTLNTLPPSQAKDDVLKLPLSRRDSINSSGAGHDSDLISADERPGQTTITAASSLQDHVGNSMSSVLHPSTTSPNGRVVRTESARKGHALAAARAVAVSASTSQSHPPSSFKRSLNPAFKSSEELQLGDESDSHPAKRISTVSSNFSTYKDAEEEIAATPDSSSAVVMNST